MLLAPRLNGFDTLDFSLECGHVLLQLSHALFQRALMLFQQQPTGSSSPMRS